MKKLSLRQLAVLVQFAKTAKDGIQDHDFQDQFGIPLTDDLAGALSDVDSFNLDDIQKQLSD